MKMGWEVDGMDIRLALRRESCALPKLKCMEYDLERALSCRQPSSDEYEYDT